MSKIFKAAPIIIIVAALALLLMAGRNLIDSKLPALGGTYYKDFKSEAELEYKYSQPGPYEVKDRTVESGDDNLGDILVWYPDGGEEKYPMIIVANPSMLPASNYKPFFSRLASWGFIVVGNEEKQSGTGAGTSKTLDVMLDLVDTHPLKNMIDYDSIGLVGYSQGGAGALAALSEYENSSYFKALFTGSAVCPEVSEEHGWKYDTSKVQIPYFMTAGTGDSDAGNDAEDVVGVAPFVSLMDSYDSIDDGVSKVRARAVGAEHGDMLKRCDGYMTAWMLSNLKGDSEAAKAFDGSDAEILTNANWQDVEKNN